MEGKVSPKTLENGKVLCYLKLRFLEDIGDEQAMAALKVPEGERQKYMDLLERQ